MASQHEKRHQYFFSCLQDGSELIYARQKIVTVAKAFGLQAIDMVHIDFKDLEGLKQHSEASANMGFTGKQVIHPGQIEVVHNSYRQVQVVGIYIIPYS